MRVGLFFGAAAVAFTIGSAQATTVQISGTCYYQCTNIRSLEGAALEGFIEVDDSYFTADSQSTIEALGKYAFSSGDFSYDGADAEWTEFYVGWGSEPGSIYNISLFAFDSADETRLAPLLGVYAYRDYPGGARASLDGFGFEGVIYFGNESIFTVAPLAPIPLPPGGALIAASILGLVATGLGRCRRKPAREVSFHRP